MTADADDVVRRAGPVDGAQRVTDRSGTLSTHRAIAVGRGRALPLGVIVG